MELDLVKASSEEIEKELSFLILEKKKLLKRVDELDTNIIGLREELRNRKMAIQATEAILNQDMEDTSF